MTRNTAFALSVLLGCACSFAADDPVQVDNDTVRILKVVDLPHVKSPLHRHERNRVMIYLDPADITLTFKDGRRDSQHWKAGQVAWSPAGARHTSENMGSAPIRIIEIELKKPAPAAPSIRKPELDPVKIDPPHNTLLFENAQVRAFRSWREAGGTEMMHQHAGAGRVAVPLTDLEASVKSQDGPPGTMRGSAADVFWSGPTIHATTNLSPRRSEIIVVEVK